MGSKTTRTLNMLLYRRMGTLSKMMEKQVAIVGAGIGGLCAIKCCLEEGLKPMCFEQHDRTGGIWWYTEEIRPNQGAASFQSLVTNTSKELSCFSDFPVPDDYPQYIPHHRYNEYLDMYANHFDLIRHIHFRTSVVKVTPAEDFEETGRWIVHTRNESSGTENQSIYDAVFLCSGAYIKPCVPSLPGSDIFQGQVFHMITHRTSEIFKNKKVLVVGNKNSAGDLAADASHVASQVYISIADEGTRILSRFGQRGKSLDLQLQRFRELHLPYWLANLTSGTSSSSSIVDHAKFNLTTNPNAPLFAGAYMVNDEISYKIVTAKVIPKPRLVKLTERGAVFSDGSVVDGLDVVAFATGYDPDYSYVDCKDLRGKTRIDYNLYKWVLPIDLPRPTLALTDFIPVMGPHGPAIELQCRWAARAFSGRLNLPPKEEMKKYLEQQRHHIETACEGKIQVRLLPYHKELAEELGVFPRFTTVFWRNPMVALLAWLGPSFPVHYRLIGPGKWADAWSQSFRAYYRAKHTPNPSAENGKENSGGNRGNWVRWIGAAMILPLLAVPYALHENNNQTEPKQHRNTTEQGHSPDTD